MAALALGAGRKCKDAKAGIHQNTDWRRAPVAEAFVGQNGFDDKIMT